MSSKIILIKGVASQSTIKELKVTDANVDIDLLTLLQSENIPIASSCMGDGVCQKCMVNTDKLACELTPRKLNFNAVGEAFIYIDYL
ncbi:MAG: hypothetical protein KC493_15185 [Bacteriovoracaceae bacterium]|nr:hypothetical protein [Bacteriovoracaceae bacterium]